MSAPRCASAVNISRAVPSSTPFTVYKAVCGSRLCMGVTVM